jgi:hypothetical protein
VIDPELAHLVAKHPGLVGSGSNKSSEWSSSYNCFAFALGENSRWVQATPALGFKTSWPAAVARQETVAAYKLVFALRGYDQCKDAALEADYEKVALYVDVHGRPQHAARQLPDGRWTSKMGQDIDIEHPDVAILDDKTYGRPSVFLRRPKPNTPAP